MQTFINRHFPKTKTSWKRYLSVFLPIILAQTIIALNGMIDNFMVGHVPQGPAALGAVNSWTNIYTGLLLATAAAGSIALAQFYHNKDYAIVRHIARYRFMINIVGALILFVLVWVIPHQMIGMFMSSPSNHLSDYKATSSLTQQQAMALAHADYNTAMDNAEKYIHITTAQWLLYSITYDMGSQLREVGHAKITFYTSIVQLCYHITLNGILLYGVHMGITGPAIAGATSQLFPLGILTFYIIKKKVQVSTKPWEIFNVSKKALKILLKRYIYFLSVFTVVFFITFRNHFWDTAYPVGEDNIGKGVSGLAVLALTGAIMNIFTTTFAAAPAMAANFVSSELGKGNLEQAKTNSDEIKGFNTLVAVGMSLLLLCFSFIVPHMTFMISAGEGGVSGDATDAKAFLNQVSYSTMAIAFWYPIWIWFVSSYRNSQSGGKGGFMAITDWVVSGPIQLGFLALMAYKIIPSSDYLQHNFWLAYFIFFATDLFKMFAMEWYYYRYTWLHSLTHSEANQAKNSKWAYKWPSTLFKKKKP